jgi:hypothetical protein
MELLGGEDLAQHLARAGRLAPRALVDILLPVCSALVAAHKATVVHRDLKPRNIFLAVEPHGVQPKVLDFGLSKSNEIVSALTESGALIGTPYYLAPEQIQNARSAGAASDQYALGVIMYECLSGQRPFTGDSVFAILQAIVNERPRPIGQRCDNLPPGLATIVERAMKIAPRDRFPSMWALGHALLPFASPKAQAIWSDAFAAGREGKSHRRFVPRLSGSHTVPMPAPARRAALGRTPVAARDESLGEPRGGPHATRKIVGVVALAAVGLGLGLAFVRGPRPDAKAAAARLAASPPVAVVPGPAVVPPPSVVVAPATAVVPATVVVPASAIVSPPPVGAPAPGATRSSPEPKGAGPAASSPLVRPHRVTGTRRLGAPTAASGKAAPPAGELAPDGTPVVD